VEKETDWLVPDERVAVAVFVTELPWVTDLFPPLEREKSKAGGGGGGGVLPGIGSPASSFK